MFIGEAQQTAYFLIGQIIVDSVYECDFQERFSDYEGTVTIDLLILTSVLLGG
jgi:hypothetical protein